MAARLYVVQQDGGIKVLRNGVATVFADLSTKVTAGGERGPLGLAFPVKVTRSGGGAIARGLRA